MRRSRFSASLLSVALLLGFGRGASADDKAGAASPGAPSSPPQTLDELAAAPVRQQIDPASHLPFVRLRTGNPRARLQIFQQRWQDVCTAPCNLGLNPVGPYRVGGETVSSSSPFGLPRRSGSVLIDVKTGSKVGHWVGFGLTMAGLVAAANGGIFFVLAEQTTAPSSEDVANRQDGLRAVGTGSLVAAAILVAVGLPLWLINTTRVDIE